MSKRSAKVSPSWERDLAGMTVWVSRKYDPATDTYSDLKVGLTPASVHSTGRIVFQMRLAQGPDSWICTRCGNVVFADTADEARKAMGGCDEDHKPRPQRTSTYYKDKRR